jgi:hypothetical protein
MDNLMTSTNETGQITLTGLHEGDQVVTESGGSFRVTSCRYVSFNRPPAKSVNSLADAMLPVSFAPDTFGFMSKFAPSFNKQNQKEDNLLVVKPDAFSLAASVEVSSLAGQATVRVGTKTNLAAAPQVEVILTGENKGQTVNLTFDKNSGNYIGQVSQLPLNGTGYLHISAVNEKGERVTRTEIFSITETNLNKDKEEAFSADGQLSLSASAGTLPKGARLSISPSETFAPELAEGFAIVGRPFKISASSGDKLNKKAVLRFQLPNQIMQQGNRFNGADSYDPTAFEIRRLDEKSGDWKSLGGLLISELSIVTVEIDELGSYLLVARPLSNSSNVKTKTGKKQTDEKFAVTDAALKAENSTNFGKCPVLVKFTGFITTNAPGIVKYTITRSDGATGPVQMLDFKEAGTQTVSTDWTLGGVGLTGFEGWQGLKILSPNEFETNSDTAHFVMKCEP